jgi:hypothetical protein
MGQAKRDKKIMACRSEMPGQYSQYIIAGIGLPGQDSSAGMPRTTQADFVMIKQILAIILALSLN